MTSVNIGASFSHRGGATSWHASSLPHIIDDMASSLRRISLAVLTVIPGLLLGILILEPVVRSNTTLLPRGISAPLPVDAPLTDRSYDVHYADADIFYWEASLIRPPGQNLLEARVHWRTDEFGFPNPAPIPARVDLVVLGRSYAMGAQAENPWPDILRQKGLSVLNLSQTGAGLGQKWDFLRRFGLPRNPRYVLIEILPPMDILEYGTAEPWVVQRLLFPLAQSVLRRLFPPSAAPGAGGYIYPLPVEYDDGRSEEIFYSRYLSALTISAKNWTGSEDWKNFRADLTDMVSALRKDGIIPILLFVPTKETIFVPRVTNAQTLEPALGSSGSWQPMGGRLQWIPAVADADRVVKNAASGENMIGEFADGLSVCWVNPSAAFWNAIREGSDPFMVYDTHWSAVGHELVAEGIADLIDTGACR
jgi:hypothetical protein